MHNLQGKVGTYHANFPGHGRTYHASLRIVVSRSTPGDLTRKKDAILSSLEVVVNELMNTSTFFENRVFLPKKSIC